MNNGKLSSMAHPVLLLLLFVSLFFMCDRYPPKKEQLYPDSYKKGMNIFFRSDRNRYDPIDWNWNMHYLKSIGVNHLYLIPFYFSKNERADSIFPTEHTIADSSLIQAIEYSVRYGFSVTLKPHIDLLDNVPRYKIQPIHPDRWMRNYIRFIDRYVDISNRMGLSSLVIGTELDHVVDHKLFPKVIRHIRSRFRGSLIYAASYDHALKTHIWKEVDYIGVNAYYRLCGDQESDLKTMVASWRYWLQVLERVAENNDKPLLITEVGYVSKNKCAINPGLWGNGNRQDFQCQAHCYESLLMQAYFHKKIDGIFWWQWELNGTDAADNMDYTPQGKPAEKILKKYWAN